MEGGVTQLGVLIYGASGYTGRLIAETVVRRGGRPILAGRGRARLDPVASQLGAAMRVLPLDDPDGLAQGVADVGLVLNAAGPFVTTAPPLMDACLRSGVHYVDVGGDLRVFEHAHGRSHAARQAGVMLMPGAGFVVAATDCLAAALAARLPLACALDLGISRPTLWSRGSMQSLMDLWSDEVVVRRDGRRCVVALGELCRGLDFGWGERHATAMAWPDTLTAHLTTGIPDVTVYGEVDAADRILLQATRLFGRALDAPAWRDVMRRQWSILPDGPHERTRAGHRRVVVAEVRDASGRSAGARLRTPDPYTLTARVAADVIQRVCDGEAVPGHQTPARVFGPGLVIDLPDVELELLATGAGGEAQPSASSSWSA